MHAYVYVCVTPEEGSRERDSLSTLTVDSLVSWTFMGMMYSMVKQRPTSSPVTQQRDMFLRVTLVHKDKVGQSREVWWDIIRAKVTRSWHAVLILTVLFIFCSGKPSVLTVQKVMTNKECGQHFYIIQSLSKKNTNALLPKTTSS